ncbi:MAG: hypothetical protein MdMp014T_0540 [Treponematales bacterium]
MLRCPLRANEVIPAEYRETAEALFSPTGDGAGGERGPAARLKAAEAFAGFLGVAADYRKVFPGGAQAEGASIEGLLVSFQHNLALLIQKTWVEKTDEARKERLQGRIPLLVGDIREGSLVKALEDFGAILEELAGLFFGAQSRTDDFIEYALRIDTQMGLFWWYAGQINRQGAKGWLKSADRNSLMVLLLLGICYLTDF